MRERMPNVDLISILCLHDHRHCLDNVFLLSQPIAAAFVSVTLFCVFECDWCCY